MGGMGHKQGEHAKLVKLPTTRTKVHKVNIGTN